jgi:hypothetical protein
MTTKTLTAIITATRRHPDPDRAHAVIRDIMQRISSGEDLEAIEAIYTEDLFIMRGEA